MPNYLCFTANTAGSTISMTSYGSPVPSISLETSTDGSIWTTFAAGTTVITLANAGDKVYFRGNNTRFYDDDNWAGWYFTMSNSIAASGNIMSLVDSTCESLVIPSSYCFSSLFYRCTSLTTAPALPATTLANYCYSYIFSGCTSLTTAPALPATTLANGCYYNMFYGCTSLTTAPVLPATTLVTNCYGYIFSGCTSLTTAPVLPATTLVNSCYMQMFASCTSLTTAPTLPATTLAINCYMQMFYRCTSLTTAPALPATTLANDCYSQMFQYCSALQVYSSSGTGHTCVWKVPTSGAGTGSYTSQYQMFYGTTGDYSSTSSIDFSTQQTFYTQNEPVELPVLKLTTTYNGNTIIDNYETQNPLVVYNGTQIATGSAGMTQTLSCSGKYMSGNLVIGGKTLSCANKIMASNVVNTWVEPYNGPELCFTANIAGSTITSPQAFEYSTDGTNWSTYSSTITLTNAGDKIYFRNGSVGNPTGTSGFGTFTMTGSIAASGNIMSLVDNTCKSLVIPCDNCFYGLFNSCTSLTTAPTLPATTLTLYCYYWMFTGCTSLTTAPALPATTLATYCYSYMFYGCTSLTTAPVLPATTLTSGCYWSMFTNCTSLTTAPKLPATTLATYCYFQMFGNCTSLTTAPKLPATTLTNSCYYWMFVGCASLQVYSSSGTGHTCIWKVPTSGTGTGSYTSQSKMFEKTTGDYASTTTINFSTQQTFYTQNAPV